jgi:hypothetical protein
MGVPVAGSRWCVHSYLVLAHASNSPSNTFQILTSLTNDLSRVRQNRQTAPVFELTNQNVFLSSSASLGLGDVSSEGSVMMDHSVHLQEEGCCGERGQSVYSDGVHSNNC